MRRRDDTWIDLLTTTAPVAFQTATVPFLETVYTNAAAGWDLKAEGCIVLRVLDQEERFAEEGEGWVKSPTMPEGCSVDEEALCLVLLGGG